MKRKDPGSRPLLMALLEFARSRGAVDAELLLQRRHDTCLHWTSLRGRPGRCHRTRRTHDCSFSVRVWDAEHREGSASWCGPIAGPGRSAMEDMLDEALARAAGGTPDPRGGPAERLDVRMRGLGTDDPRYLEITDSMRFEIIEMNQSSCATDKGIRLLSQRLREGRTTRSFVSSRGVDLEASSTSYSLEVEAVDRECDRRLDRVSVGRNFAHVASLPLAAELSRRLLALRARRVSPPPGLPLVLSPISMAWVIGSLAPAFAIDRIEAGTSFLAGWGDRPLGVRRMHLIDDGSLHGAVRTEPFDDRGVPPLPLTVLKEGVPGAFYLDVGSARRLGLRPTGHEFGGALRPSNLVLRQGNRSRTQMLSEVPVSVMVEHLAGELDVATGRLRAAGPGFLLRKGHPEGVVDRIRLDLHVADLLSAVRENSSDQERHGANDASTILLDPIPFEAG